MERLEFRPFFSTVAVLIIALSGGYAQSGFNTIGGANFLGYGRAGVNLGGIGSIYFNQAGLADVKNIGIDVSVDRRYNLSELSTSSIAIAKSTSSGTFGLMFSSFGFSDYSEQKIGLAYGRKLHPNLKIGGQFDMLRYSVAQIGTKNIFTFELGAQLKVSKEFQIGIHLFSPGNSAISESETLGSRFRLGVKYTPSKKIFMLVEVEKLINRDVEYRLGLGYDVAKGVHIMLGMNPTISTFSFGAAFTFVEKYKIASAMALHNSLGAVPALSLQYAN